MNNKNEFIGTSIGSYQICFSHNLVLPLNKMQEDKIIHAGDKNFIVLRHAFVDIETFGRISNSKDLKIEHVNSNHINYNQDGSYSVITTKFLDCKLKYISWENCCDDLSSFKVVIEYGEIIPFVKIEDCTREGIIL